ncbi:6-phosphogluconolactonase [Halioglobus japonicus]|nr:6-phosphogluconolactonase [Halioglobus japonicus]
MPRPVHQFETNAELSAQLAARIAADLDAAIAEQGSATLAVSGGSTPRPLFEALSQQVLDWSLVAVTQVDERWVQETHSDSNARLIKQHLMQNEAGAAEFLSMKTPEDSPFAAESAASLKLARFAAGIDVLVLGMGEDGHTASFFPGASSLMRAMDPAGTEVCVAVQPPEAAHNRMTLSLATLLRARHAYLHIVGETKWDVLELASEEGDVALLPIRALLHSNALELEIYYANRN